MTTSIRFRIYLQHQLSDISWKKERTDGENNIIKLFDRLKVNEAFRVWTLYYPILFQVRLSILNEISKTIILGKRAAGQTIFRPKCESPILVFSIHNLLKTS